MDKRRSERIQEREQRQKVEEEDWIKKALMFLETKKSEQFLENVRKALPFDDLIRRGQKNCGLGHGFVHKVVEEYARFLALKVALKLIGLHENISPSDKVDLIWHQHILDTKMYETTWEKIGGGLMHHNIDRSDDQLERAERIKGTADIYLKWFSRTPPSEVWDLLHEKFDQNLLPGPFFQVFIRDLECKTWTFLVKSGTPTWQLMKMIEEKIDVPADQQRLIYAGRQLDQDATMEEREIHAEATIHLILRSRGC